MEERTGEGRNTRTGEGVIERGKMLLVLDLF